MGPARRRHPGLDVGLASDVRPQHPYNSVSGPTIPPMFGISAWSQPIVNNNRIVNINDNSLFIFNLLIIQLILLVELLLQQE